MSPPVLSRVSSRQGFSSVVSYKRAYLGRVTGVYQVSRSLRFNSPDSAYLSRIPATSSTDRKASTYSFWMKLDSKDSAGTQGSNTVLSCYDGSGPYALYWNFLSDANGRRLSLSMGGASDFGVTFSPSFRDPSAWYHIVIVLDTANATSTDRIRLYVNGARVTDTASALWPTQNYQPTTFISGQNTNIGVDFTTAYANYFNGLLADIHFIDGQAVTPSSFGQTDANGVWQPKAYTGTYGTNGFRLNFADNSAATATTLGKDVSGNGNNWTPNNLSVTAGAGNDSLVDSPTNYGTDTGVGGEVRGNYATLNPLQNTGNTLSNGNLDVLISSTNWTGSTIAMATGKWYAEFTVGSTGTIQMFGVCNADFYGTGGNAPWITAGAKEVTYYVSDGRVYVDGVNTGTTSGSSAGDIISFAFDADARSVAIRKNNTLLTTKTITAASAGYIFYVSSGGGSCTATLNYGSRPFAYTAPSGFKALCTTNLPTPTGVVAQPSTVMDVKLYTGNGSTQSITGLGFSPDLVWVKRRDTSAAHRLTDTVRGSGYSLYSDLTNGELLNDPNGYISALSSDGFTVTAGSIDAAGVNTSSSTYAAWCWDAGSTTVTNTQGSITSSVRANASAGFSIVTWTGSNTASTIGHGLGVAPAFIITKSRNNAIDWQCYHVSLGKDKTIALNSTGAVATVTNYWGSAEPTSTVFGTRNASGDYNNTGSMVAYCFAPVAGYSSFGVVTATGTSDGGFAYTGFRPRFLLYKNASSTGNWGIYDTARDPENVCDNILLPSSSSAEFTSAEFDLLSNGIKLRYPYTNGHQFVFAAFAEAPFQFARAR